MRLLRFLCNAILYFFMVIAISLVQIGVYDVIAAQSKDIEGIHIVSQDDSVSYFDSYTFWGTDIKENITGTPTKYRVRQWFSGSNGWVKNMKWADSAVDFVISVIKPIFVPLAEVNAVMKYYDRDINYFAEEILTSAYLDENSEADRAEAVELYNNALYERYVVFAAEEWDGGYIGVHTHSSDGEIVYYVNSAYSEDEACSKVHPILSLDYDSTTGEYIVVYDLENDIKTYGYLGLYTGDWAGLDDENGNLYYDVSYSDYCTWLDDNKLLYNTNWKLTKYNNGSFGTYFNKFIKITDSGDRTIKSSVIVLYYQQYVSMILALIFVIKYPISFIQGKIVGKKRKNEPIA